MDKNIFIEKILIPYLIPILLILFFSVIILLFLNRFAITNINSINKKLKRKINVFLPEILLGGLSETGKNLEIEKFKNDIHFNNYWFKELLVKSLIESKNSLKGVAEAEFRKIYEAFDLDKHSYRFLNNLFVYYKKKGIYQFEMMDYKPAAKDIEPYMYHRNKKLSANALIAYIILTDKDVSFLINIKYEPSFAKEIEILEICKIRKFKRPDLLKDFLLSDNDFIVRIGLRLAVYYNASDLESEIANCMDHKNPQVRELAYKALGSLFLVDKTDEMVSRYGNETANNQTQIILSLREIGTKDHLDFLKPLLLMSHRNELEIARAIKSIDSNTLLTMAHDNKKVNKIEKHINENLLK
ncbi:HEAT repeat domain-containing protein [Psychroflexus sediminis]|uniref:HEAT repeat-containing protein n=1 Tax=Psychroflexus sediminis TaxID=470826 RepID=A0A1G7XE20_9FLAO|nr:HEAT repeat domain-containing protein [Psychroflexus sediminis]SDG81800.1 hypothetical protein SAMN04488027_10820 [Psychroflexus sediminis]